MEELQLSHAREDLNEWLNDTKKNIYSIDKDFIHSIQFYFPEKFATLDSELKNFGEIVATELEPLVAENNLAINLPRLEHYDSLGLTIDEIVHHPAYIKAGNLIYQTRLLERMSKAGGLTECLTFLFLSAQAGEAGHNCPIACSAGMIRVLQQVADFPLKNFYLQKLLAPSFENNFTGAQFVTEIQGGSDVALNVVRARQDKNNHWRLYGEKWFCSNANAELFLVTARYDEHLSGTKGLGLFLVPAEWEKHKNNFLILRLKNKIGTRTMATAEIDFNGAHAIPMGVLQDGFHLLMDNVLHLSRLFNAFCVLGMARRAYFIAKTYAEHRVAFSHPIIDYPLIKENLTRIKAENTALLAGIFATAKLQDQFDLNKQQDPNIKLLLRLLVNLQKYLTAAWSFEHIHHALDVLAGNGMIETFSPLPRLLRDCIVCENWEGTHNVLRMQVLKDILKYNIDKIYFSFLQQQLQKLSECPEKELLTKAKKALEEMTHSFRQLNSEQQQFVIKKIVDRMGILFCSIMLLKEGLHQQACNSNSKLACYHYFQFLHLEKNSNEINPSALKFLDQILI